MNRRRQPLPDTLKPGILLGRNHRSGTARLTEHLEAFGASSDRGLQPPGRCAVHDRVAMCLLRKDLESALPVRREIRIARNRRRLVLVGLMCMLWWLAGRLWI